MGVFKAVGFPEDVGEFYRLDEYEGYAGRRTGATQQIHRAGGAARTPLQCSIYSIVHNGEISSYDANRRFIEMFGYKCTLLTDTEVITYMVDYLLRKQGLTLEEMASVIAAPFWKTIEAKPKEERETLAYLLQHVRKPADYGPVFHPARLRGRHDGLKRQAPSSASMVVGEKDDMVYVASEECASA